MNLFEKYPGIEVPTTLNPGTIQEMWAQWNTIDLTKNRIVLLHGQSGVFCAGMDLDWVANETIEWADIEAFRNFLQTLMTSPAITIAMVNGAVTGGGLGLVSACDFVVATEQSSFQLTEGMMGLVPGVILPALLNRLSRQTLKRMVFSARKFRSNEAQTMGLIDEVSTLENLPTLLQSAIAELTVCKRQSVQDLKGLLEKALTPKVDLGKEGALLLQYRLADSNMKSRLSCIAQIMKSIKMEHGTEIG